jgi:hypothetical protein
MLATVDIGGSPAFTETFATVPRWTMRGVVALLVASAGLSAFLLASKSFRSAGEGLLVISVPLLTAALIVVGASQTGTQRIDDLTERFLRETVADKLHNYLIRQPAAASSGDPVLSPMFDECTVRFDRTTPSWCRYRFRGADQTDLTIVVKCNVLNFEMLIERLWPSDRWLLTEPAHLTVEAVEDLEEHADCPAVSGAIATLRGSLHEGYSIAIDARPSPDGTVVLWQLRQKLTERVILSPVMRRYFAEDAAIAAYFLSIETAVAVDSGESSVAALSEPFRQAADDGD